MWQQVEGMDPREQEQQADWGWPSPKEQTVADLRRTSRSTV